MVAPESTMVPLPDPATAVRSPSNFTFVADPGAAAGSKFRITLAEFPVPTTYGPWMWPSLTFDVRPWNVKFQLNTLVTVSSVALNTPVPLLVMFAPTSPPGVMLTLKLTTWETGGVELSLPQAAAAITAAAVESAMRRFRIGGPSLWSDDG